MTSDAEEKTPISSDKNHSNKPIGFWRCWSLTVGIMIGSGIFLLPTILAPYGLVSFGGWIITAGGSILLALVFARLAARTTKSGGVYVYARNAFGDVTGFLIAWGYWASYWIAIPAAAIAFVGYLSVFIPAIEGNSPVQASTALALIWLITLINIKGIGEASLMQLVMTSLKLVPLALIILLGLFTGDTANLPPFNPAGHGLLPALATTALLTMWAFSGMEAGTMPADDISNPERTIPRAIVTGTIVVAFVYITSTTAVMALVPTEILINSTSPFADAAKALGPWGPKFIAFGALISTAGALNGLVFIAGQMPMAVALDKLIPSIFGKKNKGGAPTFSLLLASSLGSLLLLANYSRGLVGTFTFLIMMSTLAFLTPLLSSALAEIKYSGKRAKVWTSIAFIALGYTLFAILGSGLEIIQWGIAWLLLGIPIYFVGRQRKTNNK